MTKRMNYLLPLCGILIALGASLWAQKGPAPKTQKELDALKAWQAATDPDERIKAIENVLTNFADTEFKIVLLEDAMQLEQRKRDFAQVVFYGERLLDADPKNAFALVTLAGETARHVREFDLDKEEKLTKADKYAAAALEAAKSMPKPRPDIPDAQWESARKDMQAQAYEALGQTALMRKKFDDAIAEYKKALEVQATTDPATWVRLGQAYEDSGKYDEATAAFDKAINVPDVNPQVKSVAEAKKSEVAKRKGRRIETSWRSVTGPLPAMSEHLEVLEAVLEHPFKNRELLQRALTHKSRVYEKSIEDPAADNEQFEFLGDAILGFLVSEALVAQHPAFPEGRLSKLKAHLVSASHLHQVALRLQLGHHLLLGRGEEMSGGREKKALLANALEALIAALYLDAGVDPVRAFVVQYIVGEAHLPEEGGQLTDHKSALQEMAQALKLPQPRYAIVEEHGPEHAKTFLVEVRVGRDWVSRAEGLSKKSAGQKAAQQILQQLADWAADI